MSEAIRVLVVDDHPVVREGLVAMLGTQADFEVVGDVGSGRDAVQWALKLRPDLVLLDMELPDLSGVEVIRLLREQAADTKIVVFTAFDRDEEIVGAVRAGAEGYLLKGAPRERVFGAIRVVHAGGSLIEPMVAAKLLRQVREDPHALTSREAEVLALVASGRSNRQIARELFVSERTIKFHVSSILAKLGAANRTEAAARARAKGILPQ